MRLPGVLGPILLGSLAGSAGWAQPRLILPEATTLRPGSIIPETAVVYDAAFAPHPLRRLIGEGEQLTVLVLFGGAVPTVPSDFRGPLWCQDSFDDLAVQRAIVNEFKDRPVRFIGIAVPPVFATDRRYGFEPRVFLESTVESEEFRAAFEAFVKANEDLRSTSLLPFDALYYDPKLLTLGKAPAKGDPPGSDPRWRGIFKAENDPRRYGAPTIWIVDRDGVVMTEAFLGNDYGSSPPIINYGFAELRSAIDSALGTVRTP